MNEKTRLRAPIDKYSVDPIFQALAGCSMCKLSPLHNSEAKQVIMPVGNRNAKMAILFEGGGNNENDTGFTVVGWSYQIVEWLSKLGFNELEDYLRLNSILCHAPGNREPTGTELNQCYKNTDYILNSMPNLKLLVLCGNIALKQIEGPDALLSLRNGNLGRITNKFGKKEIYTLALRHPAYLAYIENKYGVEKATLQYISQLQFLRKVYDNIDKLDYQIPYDYNFIENKDQIIELIRELRTKETIFLDLESGPIRRGWAPIVTCSFSYQPYQSFCIPFRQITKSNTKKIISTKKGKKNYTIDFELIPYHEDEKFFKYMIEELKLLLEERGQQRPNISIWNSNFEYNCFKSDLGIEISPTIYQMQNAGNLDIAIPHCLMKAWRLCQTDINSLSLRTVLSAMLPLEASQKDPIEIFLSETDIQESGFAKMAVKDIIDPSVTIALGRKYDNWKVELENEKTVRKRKGNKSLARLPKCPLSESELEVVNTYYCPVSGLTRIQTLVNRGNFDVDVEGRLLEIWREQMRNNEKLNIKNKFGEDDIWI